MQNDLSILANFISDIIEGSDIIDLNDPNWQPCICMCADGFSEDIVMVEERMAVLKKFGLRG